MSSAADGVILISAIIVCHKSFCPVEYYCADTVVEYAFRGFKSGIHFSPPKVKLLRDCNSAFQVQSLIKSTT